MTDSTTENKRYEGDKYSREQFEKWTKGPQPEGTYDLTRIPSGAYKNAETRVAFQAWQASREELAVENAKLSAQLKGEY